MIESAFNHKISVDKFSVLDKNIFCIEQFTMINNI